jgi:hypothetical protein
VCGARETQVGLHRPPGLARVTQAVRAAGDLEPWLSHKTLSCAVQGNRSAGVGTHDV